MHQPARVFIIWVVPLAPAVIAVWAALNHRPVEVIVALLAASAALGVSAYFRNQQIKRRSASPPTGRTRSN